MSCDGLLGTLVPNLVRHADRAAIYFAGEAITHHRLLAAAERVAGVLRGRGIGAGQRVVVAAEKGPEVIAALIGILASGAAYVPVDPKQPKIRRDRIVADCDPALILYTDRTLAIDPEFCAGGEVERVRLAGLFDGAGLEPAEALGAALLATASGAEALAYILYTSGSTGTPKGVAISHGNAMNFVAWAAACFPLEPTDRVAIHSSIAFDLPVFDIYVGLNAGACLYPVPEDKVLFPESTRRFLVEHAITVLYAVPSALIAMLRRSKLAATGLPDLRLLLYAGEEFPLAPLVEWRAAVPQARVFNLYGPIETNVVTAFEVTHASLAGRRRVPLGCAVADHDLRLVDVEDGREVTQPDAKGELVIAGPSVFMAYWRDLEKTRAKMIRLRLDGVDVPYYRSGDLASRSADGLFELHGRIDHMVKTRGYRVELSELDAILSEHPGIAEAAVIARPDDNYTNLIHAFVSPKPGVRLEVGDIGDWLADRAPAYALPASIRVLPVLPKGDTGKISRLHLADLDATSAPPIGPDGSSPR